ncbi:hypothetical protein RHMOL_Rhmol06G0201000 [Rhododendron molle]|uniref:Uncharacterized protein n=1 Tax=Rhododendron molle TaxID=49168 RepID=A0ACC0NFJ1_RHOML|nr:hypothetical protein RHMOL_Rhmol06G0201000 [Rhododendron molle]
MSSDFKKICVRNLVADKKPEFFLLQESKLEVVDRFIMQRIWFDADFEFAVVQAEGASRGKEGYNLERIFAEGFWIKVGSGLQTSFWKDVWCGNQAPRFAFPILYSASNQKNASVGEIHDSSNMLWNLSYRRSLFSWDKEEENELKCSLEAITLQPGERDSLRGRWDNQTENCLVKSCYDKWENVISSQNYIGPLCKMIWKNVCPLVACHVSAGSMFRSG